MIDGIKDIFLLFLDKSKHWTLRAGLFITVLSLIIIFDLTSNISYNLYLNGKLENIKKFKIDKKPLRQQRFGARTGRGLFATLCVLGVIWQIR